MNGEEAVTILKIDKYVTELEGNQCILYKGHELIHGFSRIAALRFIYEMYMTHPNCHGYKVDGTNKVAVGATSDTFHYEMIE